MSAAPQETRARPHTQVATRVGAALRAHEHRTAAGLLALVVLVYLWPVLVGGDVLSPASLLWRFAPWSASAPPEALHATNDLLVDVPLSYYPWDALARELLHAGTFPAWNPHAFAGTPFFANLSVAWLSPFSLPLWILPLNYALGVSAALKLWVAAFGTYLLVRELRLGFWPGVIAGVSYALCAFDVAWLSHQAHVAVAALLPLMILLTERIVRRGAGWEGVALAVVVAAALAGGHPETQLHVLAGTLVYAGVRSATTAGVPRGRRAQRLAAIGGALLVGALLTAIVLVPAMRAAADTVGEQVRRASHDGTLPFKSLQAAVFPDWWGRPSEGVIAGPANYNERVFYAGTVSLLLAAIALVSPGGWRRKAPFAVLAALGVALALGAPVIQPLVVDLPGFDRVTNQRLLLWFAFAVPVLGAFGLDAALRAPRRQLRSWAVLTVAVAAGVVAIGAISLAPGDVGRALHHLTDRFAGATPGALALASVLRWLLLVSLVALALALVRLPRGRARHAGAFVALLTALDMLTFAHGYQPMAPRAAVVPGRMPAIAFLQRHADDGRMAGLALTLPADWSTVYGLRDARGYDAPQPGWRFYRLWTVLNEAQGGARPFQVALLSPPGLRVLGVLGVRYLVSDPKEAVLPTEPGFRALSAAYRGADATVFENALAAPRAFAARRVHVAGSAVAEVQTVAGERFDPRRDAVVRRAEVGADPPPGVNGSVRVVSEANARVTLHASLPHRGLVVLDDAWARGWSVAVDGRPARALQADVVMRGVVVPAGAHEIVWRYRVPGLALGALLSALGLAALAAWAGVLVARSRRAVR